MNFNNKDVREVSVMKPELRKEGVKLVSLKRDKDEKNNGANKCIIFTFADKLGNQLAHREFDPKRLETMDNEAWEKSQRLVHSRVAHITRAYLPEEEFNAIEGANWGDYLKNTFMALGVAADGSVAKAKAIDGDGKTALKVVYRYNKKDGKYYTALPQVPPFISTSNHPKEFSVNPQYDILEIPKLVPDTDNPKTQAGGGEAAFAGAPAGGADFGGEF
jgi:hypothetical protein